jgi:hypothetical protein
MLPLVSVTTSDVLPRMIGPLEQPSSSWIFFFFVTSNILATFRDFYVLGRLLAKILAQLLDCNRRESRGTEPVLHAEKRRRGGFHSIPSSMETIERHPVFLQNEIFNLISNFCYFSVNSS